MLFNLAISLGIAELRQDMPSLSGVDRVFRGQKEDLGRDNLWRSDAILSTSRSVKLRLLVVNISPHLAQQVDHVYSLFQLLKKRKR